VGVACFYNGFLYETFDVKDLAYLKILLTKYQKEMKFHIFEAMSKSEAEEYLNEFLAFGKDRGMKVLEESLSSETALNYTIESLSIILRL
jgi:hypothetical protein